MALADARFFLELKMSFDIFNFVISYVVPYLVGAIPSGYWYCKYFHGIDITNHGSGNIGATNVSRTLGSKKLFFLIVIF